MTLRELGWPTLLSLILALACALLAIAVDLPRGGGDAWPLALVGIGLVAVAIWQTRRWWLLLLVPFIFAPMAEILALVAACALGDCL